MICMSNLYPATSSLLRESLKIGCAQLEILVLLATFCWMFCIDNLLPVSLGC